MLKLMCLFLAGALYSGEEPESLWKGGQSLKGEQLQGKSFRFSWKMGDRGGFNGVATLKRDGAIAGISSPNETSWQVDQQGRLIFRHSDGRISTVFEKAGLKAGRFHFEGAFQFRQGIVHILEEIPGGGLQGENWISGEEARCIQYSKQKFLYLDVQESVVFRRNDGTEKTIRLVSVAEHRDSVIQLIRRAEVLIEVDGKPLRLSCASYVLPTEVGGLRIQADTTSDWLPLPKRVQFSIWDSSDPLVDTGLFRFPLRNYRLFSHGMQAYNEPVHLGHRDGDPKGQRFYHNYGFDLAGYDGRDEVLSCVEGVVALLQPEEEPSTIAIEDDRGFIWEYCHLDSILPGIRIGTLLRRGQQVGILGKKGGSGNFSHLHVGCYLSRAHLDAGRMCRNLNLYPWLVAAYRKEHPRGLHAVARPHHTVFIGETVAFDGSNSLAFGSKITSFRWIFQDGTAVNSPRAERIFQKPGLYTAALWIQDESGRRDVDFCKVKVFSRSAPEDGIPTIFMTHMPSAGIVAGRPVFFRCWLQGTRSQPFRLDFGDGTVIQEYSPSVEITHRFRDPGIHVVTATASVGDLPVTQKIKVVVEE